MAFRECFPFSFPSLLDVKSVVEFYEAIRKYSTATNASAVIGDLPSLPRPPSVSVSWPSGNQPWRTPAALALSLPRPRLSLARMFQLWGDSKRPLLQVVRTLDETFAALRIKFPPFESLA